MLPRAHLLYLLDSVSLPTSLGFANSLAVYFLFFLGISSSHCITHDTAWHKIDLLYQLQHQFLRKDSTSTSPPLKSSPLTKHVISQNLHSEKFRIIFASPTSKIPLLYQTVFTHMHAYLKSSRWVYFYFLIIWNISQKGPSSLVQWMEGKLWAGWMNGRDRMDIERM